MRDLIQYAIPGFVVLLVAEVLITAIQQKDYYDARDTASSLAMGIGNVLIGVVGKVVVFGTYSFVYQFRLFTVDMSQWWAWAGLFFADDLSYYWFHRISHGTRYFWASHVVHHSSMKYNLGTALRQTWTGNLTGSFVFWIWLPLLGFSPVAVMTMQAISLLYQFWIHTELISKLPAPIEFVFNTPSHHRVHHGSDLAYLDKNHGGILIIWDRLFGTFEAEKNRPTYGLTTNVGSHNPVRIAFHEWDAIGQDMVRTYRQTHSIRTALGYVVQPPGWSHDGSRKTTRQLRSEQAVASQPSVVADSGVNHRISCQPEPASNQGGA